MCTATRPSFAATNALGPFLVAFAPTAQSTDAQRRVLHDIAAEDGLDPFFVEDARFVCLFTHADAVLRTPDGTRVGIVTACGVFVARTALLVSLHAAGGRVDMKRADIRSSAGLSDVLQGVVQGSVDVEGEGGEAVAVLTDLGRKAVDA